MQVLSMPLRSASNNFSTNGVETHYRRELDGSHTTLGAGTPVIRDVLSSFVGMDVPNFHRRRRAGELLPSTNFDQIKADGAWTSSLHRFDPFGYQFHTDQNWSHPTILVPWRFVAADLVEEARHFDFSPHITQAAANIYASGHDSLTFLAEFRKVVAMFTSAHSSLVKLLSKAPRFKGPKSLIGLMEQHWLEYRYGWRILYFDMVDIAKALAELESIRSRFSERAGSNLSTSTVTTNTYANPAAYDFTVRQVEEKHISIRGTVTADIKPPSFRFNPILTGWELIRFSFIIDWFISIGSWLESMSLLYFSTDCVAAGGVKIVTTRTAGLTNVVFNSGNTGSLNYTMVNQAEYTVRVPASVPNLPSVNVRLNMPKVIDLWALFITLLKGKVPALR